MNRILCVTIMLMGTVFSYSQPSEKLLQKAEKGNAKAQFELGRYYDYYTSDSANTVKWYRLAAEQGYKQASSGLARLYFEKKDYKESARWCERSDDDFSWGLLAGYFGKGQGVEKDYEKAAYWYEKSLLSRKKRNKNWIGFSDSRTMVILAECYDSIKNYTKAYNWYCEVLFGKYDPYAKINEYAMADALVGMIRLYHLGLGVQKDQSKVNSLLSLLRRNNVGVFAFALERAICADNEMSLFWIEYAVKFGLKLGDYWMGRICEEGKYGIEKSNEKAFDWYQKAMDDYIDAYYRLGLMFEQGRGTAKDYERAYKYYKYIIDKHDCLNKADMSNLFLDVKGRLGIMYYYGYYVVSDQDKAFEYLYEAAPMYDDPEVMRTLSYCYSYYDKVENKELAAHWLEMAEKYGDETARWLRELERKREVLNRTSKYE